MNLYEILARKSYLSSTPSHRRTQHKSSFTGAGDAEDEARLAAIASSTARQESLRRKSSAPNQKSQLHFDRPSFLGNSWPKDADEFDLLDSSKSYRRYRLLSAANSEQARAESRAYFEIIVNQVDRIKLALVCFVCFHLAFSFLLDLLAVYEFDSGPQTVIQLGSNYRVSQRRLIKSITFGLLCPAMTVGILVACRWYPQRHLFSLNRNNSMFIISVTLGLVSVAELGILACHFFEQLIPMPIAMASKSSLVGFAFIYLLYILFDVKINSVSKEEAQKHIRAYLLMTTLGVVTALIFYLYYFARPVHTVSYVSAMLNSVLLCRIFVTINCAIVFYLIWNGIGSLYEHTTISNEDFDDFLGFYGMNHASPDQLLTLNCVCLACQAKSELDQLTEDNFSIRTVKVWRQSCFSVAGSIIFSFAFSSEICHLCFTTIWSKRYYPQHISGNQIFAAQLTLLVSLLITRLFLLFKFTITGHKTTVEENKELLGHYSWHRNCHKFILTYLVNIVANLMQLYLIEHSLFMVFVTNTLFGISLGFMLEQVCRFISNYMTITSSTVQSALMTAMCHLSLMVFLLYYLLAYVQLTSPLFYLNLFGGMLSLFITIIVSRCQCLVSQNSFDLVEMQPYCTSNGTHVHHTHKPPAPPQPQMPRPHSHPDLNSLRINKISLNNLPEVSQSSALLRPTPPSTQHLMVPPIHLPSTSNSQNSQLNNYWYQVAVSDSNVHRKSSAAAVIAYRLKYRLESVVSILK